MNVMTPCRCTWNAYAATCEHRYHRELATRPQPTTAPPVTEWFVPVEWVEEAAR